jgi:hypothetical protein
LKTHDEACSPSMGPQLLQQFTLMDNGVLQKLRKLQMIYVRIGFVFPCIALVNQFKGKFLAIPCFLPTLMLLVGLEYTEPPKLPTPLSLYLEL